MIYMANNVGLDSNYYYTGAKTFRNYKCKHCGEKFQVKNGAHIYKLDRLIFCSFTCRARFIKANPPKRFYAYEYDKGSTEY